MKVSRQLEGGKLLGLSGSFSSRAWVIKHLVEYDSFSRLYWCCISSCDPLGLIALSKALDRKELSEVPLPKLTSSIDVRTFNPKRSLGMVGDDILLEKSYRVGTRSHG
jgi:hypothetical protein